MSYPTFENAACVGHDPELFFPKVGAQPREVAISQWICGRCPVQEQCCDWAYANHERYGTWGSVTAAQRIRSKFRRPA